MKKMNQKILSLLTAGVMLASTAFGMSSNAAGDNTVKFGTPVIDGVKDVAYEGSYTVSLKDIHEMGLLGDMTKFSFMETEFFEIYEEGENIMIIDPNGNEITYDVFCDEYDEDYGYLPSDVKFRWTDAGVNSEYFTNVTYTFMWDEVSLYVYAEIEDNQVLTYDADQIAAAFSSPWAGMPNLIDRSSIGLVINGRPVIEYGWEGENVVVNKEGSTDYTKITITALPDANIYFDSQGRANQYYDTEALETVLEPLTYINPFHINWWERCAYVEGEGPGSNIYRTLVCDGSDTTYNEETGAPSACADSQDVFLSRHVFTAERIAERDAGREANLDYIAGGLTDTGYTLEMSIPLTGEVWNSIRNNGYTIGFFPEVVDSDKPVLGNAIQGDGNAAKWYIISGDEKNPLELTLDTPECDGTHKYHDGIVTVEPTCVEGEMTYICALCDATTTEAIAPAYDHTVVDAPATEATCTEPAYTAGTVCSECGTYLSGHEAEGEALGHNVVDAPATEATCTEPAYTAGTMCDRCGEYLSGHEAEGEALGHTDEDKDTVCDVCGENARTAGDVNYDGKIDTKDLTRLMKAIAGQDVEIFGSDVNGDGETDTKDLTRLMKALAGEEVELH